MQSSVSKTRLSFNRQLQGSDGIVEFEERRSVMHLTVRLFVVSDSQVHMAPWMTNVIYCLETNIFIDQSQLTASERRNIAAFCLFANHINVRAWIAGPVASDTLVNDLQLNKQIRQWRIAGE